MILSRNWLNEYVDVSDISDRDFAEGMTISGSKVEITEDLGAEITKVVIGRVLTMEKHPNSDHMYITTIDVGEEAPATVVTGAWNVHVGDLVPVALPGCMLPGDKKIERSKLRGVESDGMLCSLAELNIDTHDFPYAEIKPAALLNNYKPIDPEKPSISPDIKAGDKVFGNVICASVQSVANAGINLWTVNLDLGSTQKELTCDYQNLHEGDLVAYDTAKNIILGLEDLRAEQREFPNCIPDGIFIIPHPFYYSSYRFNRINILLRGNRICKNGPLREQLTEFLTVCIPKWLYDKLIDQIIFHRIDILYRFT